MQIIIDYLVLSTQLHCKIFVQYCICSIVGKYFLLLQYWQNVDQHTDLPKKMSGNDGEIYHFKIWLNVTFVDDLLFCLNKIFHIFHSPHQKSEEVLSPSLIIKTKIAQPSFLPQGSKDRPEWQDIRNKLPSPRDYQSATNRQALQPVIKYNQCNIYGL